MDGKCTFMSFSSHPGHNTEAEADAALTNAPQLGQAAGGKAHSGLGFLIRPRPASALPFAQQSL